MSGGHIAPTTIDLGNTTKTSKLLGNVNMIGIKDPPALSIACIQTSRSLLCRAFRRFYLPLEIGA